MNQINFPRITYLVKRMQGNYVSSLGGGGYLSPEGRLMFPKGNCFWLARTVIDCEALQLGEKNLHQSKMVAKEPGVGN